MKYDESLFLEDPKDIDDYEKWMSTFDLEEENEETVNLLAHNSHLQEMYTKLVPSKVSHLVFWHRFFYLVHLMLEAEKNKVATQPPVPTTTVSEPEVSLPQDDSSSKSCPPENDDQQGSQSFLHSTFLLSDGVSLVLCFYL